MSRAKVSAAFLASLLAFAVACGAKKDKPPVTPDDTAKTDTDGGTDMPSTPGTDDKDGGGGGTGDTKPPDVKPPITVAAMKFAIAKGKKGPKAIEVKADGSVTADGKPAGKLAPDHVEDAAGKTLVSVSNDGAISGDKVAPGLKFSGDDVVGDDGAKLVTIGDDGTLQMMAGKKMDTWGKFDGGGSAKKAAAVVAVAWLMPAPAAAKPPAKPPAKPGGKK